MSDPTAAVSISTDADNDFYWQATSAERLLAQRCSACSRLWHPPGPVCPHCRSLTWTVAELPHHGVLHSVAKVHDPGSPIQGNGYLIALVELDDPDDGSHNIRIAGNLRGAEIGDITIGQRVELVWEALAGGHRLPQFRIP